MDKCKTTARRAWARDSESTEHGFGELVLRGVQLCQDPAKKFKKGSDIHWIVSAKRKSQKLRPGLIQLTKLSFIPAFTAVVRSSLPSAKFAKQYRAPHLTESGHNYNRPSAYELPYQSEGPQNPLRYEKASPETYPFPPIC